MGQEASRHSGLPRIHPILREQSTGNVEDEVDVNKLLATVYLLYASSKIRILSLADKLALSEVGSDVHISNMPPVPLEIPIADSWDFHLGDWVKIKYDLPDFKTIQSQTLGWETRLRTIHSCVAVVTKRWSSFENGVTIYTPLRLSSSLIYAGVLEKLPKSEIKEDVPSRWKVNDYVMIQSRTNEERIVKLFQAGLDDIPQRYIGRRGRIIAVTRVAIVVTFNERTSYDIKSALLVKCHDQSPLMILERKHEKGFVVGQKVIVSDNIGEVIKHQEGHGGWSADMTKCIGKEVTIIHIHKNGNLMVQYKTGRSWTMSPLSFLSQESPFALQSNAPQFSRGDIVKIKIIENIRALVRMIHVPTDILEYLRTTAEVKLVDDDLDYLIKYNGQRHVVALPTTIDSATAEEKSHHNRVKAMVKDITVGSTVFLDVGSPGYVNAVLRDSAIDREIGKALTSRAVLVGFHSDGKAVIEYEDGKRFKIKKKYLTVPDKFNM